MNYDGAKLKVGWQLGAILYEINSMPWSYQPAAGAATAYAGALDGALGGGPGNAALLLALAATGVCLTAVAWALRPSEFPGKHQRWPQPLPTADVLAEMAAADSARGERAQLQQLPYSTGGRRNGGAVSVELPALPRPVVASTSSSSSSSSFGWPVPSPFQARHAYEPIA